MEAVRGGGMAQANASLSAPTSAPRPPRVPRASHSPFSRPPPILWFYLFVGGRESGEFPNPQDGEQKKLFFETRENDGSFSLVSAFVFPKAERMETPHVLNTCSFVVEWRGQINLFEKSLNLHAHVIFLHVQAPPKNRHTHGICSPNKK